MGVPHLNMWWGTKLHLQTKTIWHGKKKSKAHHYPHNQEVKCDGENFGIPSDKNIWSKSLLKKNMKCRCLSFERTGTDTEKLEILKASSVSDCRTVHGDNRQLDQGSVNQLCKAYGEYVASYANFVAMADGQAKRQMDKHCHLNSWVAMFLKGLKSLANSLGETIPLEKCITKIVTKLMSIIDKIINPILKALQFDKLFEPIKQKIYDLMKPLISKFTFDLPDLKSLVPVINSPTLFKMDFGLKIFEPFTKGFTTLRDDKYIAKAMEVAYEVKDMAVQAGKDEALQKCAKDGVTKLAKKSLDLGQKYLLCGKRKKEEQNKGKSCDQSLTDADKKLFGLVDIVKEKTVTEIDDYFEKAMKEI